MMLRGICLGVLSLSALRLSSQSPLQACNLLEGRQIASITTTSALHATDIITPVTALTSTKTTTKSAFIIRQATDIPPAPLATSKPYPSLANPPTPTGSSAIPTKTGLRNCNVQGTPSDILVSNILGGKRVPDVLACQRACMYISRCESYSFQKSADRDSKNCLFYTALIDGKQKVDSSSTSGIFFSDKYPADGTNFCYGSSQL